LEVRTRRVHPDTHPVPRRRRTNHDIGAGGVLAGLAGVLVRDGYVGYDHIDTATHAECGAHLLRALKGVHDGDPAGQVWAEYMANTLLIAKRMMQQGAAAGHTRLSQDHAGFIRSAYTRGDLRRPDRQLRSASDQGREAGGTLRPRRPRHPVRS
jgi:transposase